MNTLTEFAYAKINLFLEVLDRRADGYHNIDTIMASLSLHDIVTLSCETADVSEPEITFSCTNADLVSEDNLCLKAARAFFSAAGINNIKAEINLEKYIPIAAGLAGGSADAAAVLRALNLLCGSDNKPLLSSSNLSSVAASIGADVPFCLFGGIAHAAGIGEKLEFIPCTDIKNRFIVSVPPSDKISTPKAYGMIDAARNNTPQNYNTSNSLISAINHNLTPKNENMLFNRFEEVIIPLCPLVDEIKNIMAENGAEYAMMSGSGPSVFGICDISSADKISKALSENDYPVFVCDFIPRYYF